MNLTLNIASCRHCKYSTKYYIYINFKYTEKNTFFYIMHLKNIQINIIDRNIEICASKHVINQNSTAHSQGVIRNSNRNANNRKSRPVFPSIVLERENSIKLHVHSAASSWRSNKDRHHNRLLLSPPLGFRLPYWICYRILVHKTGWFRIYFYMCYEGGITWPIIWFEAIIGKTIVYYYNLVDRGRGSRNILI